MRRTLATPTMLVAVVLAISLPNGAFAELTFGEWAAARGYTPPGPENWECTAGEDGITSVDGVSSYTNLQLLSLEENQISSLDANAFQGLTNLQTLSLDYNQISSLDANAFQGLSNLQRVDLGHNQIASLEANQFQGLASLQSLSLEDNQISSLDANAFQGLSNLQSLELEGNRIPSLEANQFQGLASLQSLELYDNQISSLDLTGFEATALALFGIQGNPITEVILADATLSQTTLDTLMIGYEANAWYVGIAELPGIARIDFTAADIAGVDQFDEMFGMADLNTLILTDALFSAAIVADDYAEVWDLISALDLNRLDALSVNEQLYTAMQANLDTWDAGPNNVLTVVPEPSTPALLTMAAIGLLACALRRRKQET